MNTLRGRSAKVVAKYVLLFGLVLSLTPVSAFAQVLAQPPASDAGAGLAGRVTAVNPDSNSFTAEVRVVYAGARQYGGIGGVLPVGKVVTIKVLPGTVLKDARGNIITLSQVAVDSLFNAAVLVDAGTRTITAQSIVFLNAAAIMTHGFGSTAQMQMSSASTTPPPPTTGGQGLASFLKGSVFAGRITGVVHDSTTSSISIKNISGVEESFSITATTRIFVGRTAATIADLKVGSSAALSFAIVNEVKQATEIEQAPPGVQGAIDATFSAENVQKIGERAAQLLGAFLDRLNQIIIKQEAAINSLKAAGKDTTKAEALLAVSKTDEATARVDLANMQVAFDAIATSSDPKAAAQVARMSMKQTIDATMKVLIDIKNTQVEIRTLSS